MAGLKIFISSTCVDLDAYRYQLRGLLERMGYEPVMSDHSEVLYDPELHTHASCIREVEAADIVVLLIGSRFGGAAVPQALPLIDFEQVKKSSTNTGLLSEKNKISITQAEALRAIELNVPVFTFVDSKVYSDHHVYQANRSNPNLNTMTFPSITKPETAKSVFDFISFMSHRSFNNGVIPFNSFSNIEDHLVKQWALLFQRLIHERRDRSAESKKSSDIIERIEDLKAAVLQALPAGTVRDIAKAITKYRGLLDFLYGLKSVGIFDSGFSYGASLVECLRMKGVIDIAWDDDPDSAYYAVLILEDGGFIGCFNVTDDEIVDELATDWEAFRQLSSEIRSAVIDASAEISEGARPFVRSEESFEQYRASLHEERIKQPTSVVTARRRRRVIE